MKKNNLFKYSLIFVIGLIIGILLMNKFYEPKEIDKKIIDLNDNILKGEANIVAVDEKGNGVLGRVNVQIKQGKGDILINTNPFLEPDTQYSATIASQIASNITKISLKDKDIVYNFDVQGNVLGGSSAGLSMTLAAISALKQIPLKNIAFTGEINQDESIGKIGGLFEKAQAIANNNLTLFLIPHGQAIFQYYIPIEERGEYLGKIIINKKYILNEINLTKYFKENYDLDIIEVSNIQEAIRYVF